MPYTFVALIPAGATGGPRRYLSPTLISCDLWTTRPFYVYYRDRLHRFRSLTKINYRAIRILIRESVRVRATQRRSIFRPEFRNSGAATVKVSSLELAFVPACGRKLFLTNDTNEPSDECEFSLLGRQMHSR